jgi:hypothetical protein
VLATSTFLDTRPSATESHVNARVIIASTPNAAIHSTGTASDRKPIATATPKTTAKPTIVWIELPRTCPVSTEAREMPIVRKRAMMPSDMSIATEIAVPALLRQWQAG